MNEEDLVHYMNLTDADINDPDIFCLVLLWDAASIITQTINNQNDICVIVDCDCDGYTSSAILINYLHNINPSFVEEHIHWFMHNSKQHGLADAM